MRSLCDHLALINRASAKVFPGTARHVLQDASFYEIWPLREHIMSVAVEWLLKYALLCVKLQDQGESKTKKRKKAKFADTGNQDLQSAAVALEAARNRAEGAPRTALQAVLQNYARSTCNAMQAAPRPTRGTQKTKAKDDKLIAAGGPLAALSQCLEVLAAFPDPKSYFQRADHELGLDTIIAIDLLLFDLFRIASSNQVRDSILSVATSCRGLIVTFVEYLTHSVTPQDAVACACMDTTVLAWMLHSASCYRRASTDSASDRLSACTADVAANLCAKEHTANDAAGVASRFVVASLHAADSDAVGLDVPAMLAAG